ncbi:MULTISPECIES: TetR/AcrR family transcriptional regulator [Streptomyces]|uniref:TetR/AcrR family transcriptional regulator n=1 Tax=Streptomyces TaxID=1883 RepID=UPI000F747345|nr:MULTISPECIES: TetR/AcrR family transcriptional regulator [Streptomyces]MCM3265015.1 TetR/AcrR family transcriptional regulator [Streptomyces thermoviolaceus]RSS03932.1 TetR/AcrR family transcriptional regulator [Streptomyces sp. WAC00469]
MGRRSDALRKGDLREQALLDAAEALLAHTSLENLTVEAIAQKAGISRASLYFYFGNKHEVLAALVERTMRTIRTYADVTEQQGSVPPVEAMERAVRATEQVWREHSTVMRAAVEYAALHPVIGNAWSETVERFARTMTHVLRRAGLPDGDDPGSAQALADALCWMTERTFYRAAGAPDEDLGRASATIIEVWRKVMTA